MKYRIAVDASLCFDVRASSPKEARKQAARMHDEVQEGMEL